MDFEQIKQAAGSHNASEIPRGYKKLAYFAIEELYELYRFNHDKARGEQRMREIMDSFLIGTADHEVQKRTCQMRIALAGISQKVNPNQCPILKIIDERKLNIDEADLQACVPCLRDKV